MPRPALSPVLIVAATLAAVGCSSAIRYPKLRGPGPAKYQRANAEAFDPYPLPDLGPPIDGGRPREFSTPRNEVERAQDYEIVQAARRARLTQPMTGAVVGAPAAVGPPTQFGAATTAPAFVPSAPVTTSPAPVYTPSAPVYTPTAPMPSTVPSGPRY